MTPADERKRAAETATTSQVAKRSRAASDDESTKSGSAWTKPTQIGDSDLFSSLTSLCLEEVLIYLEPDDLDVVSCVSQTLHAACDYARPGAMKTLAENFSLTQVDVNEWRALVALTVPDTESYQAYKMSLVPGNLPKKFSKHSRLQELGVRQTYIPRTELSLRKMAPVSPPIMEHLVSKLDRFECETYAFDSILINDQFIDDFDDLCYQGIYWIRFWHCAFHKRVSSQNKSRLLSLLLTKDPQRLYLKFPYEEAATILDEGFFRSYVAVVSNPFLTVEMKDDSNMQFLHVTRELMPILIEYDKLDATFLFVEVELLLEMILDRLVKRSIEASWVMTVDTELSDVQLATIDKTKYSCPSREVIEKIGEDFGAKIDFINESGKTIVVVRFGNASHRDLQYVEFI